MNRRLLAAGLMMISGLGLVSAGEVLTLHFSDNALDSSPQAHTMTTSGELTFVKGPSGFGRAVRFENPAPGPGVTPQWIDGGQDPRFKLRGDVSIAMWVKSEEAGPRANEVLLSNGPADGSDHGWRLFRHVDQTSIEFVVRGEYGITGGGLHGADVDGKWRHFTLVRQANTFRFYQDGRLLGSGAGSSLVPLPYEHLWIGGVPGQDLGFNGCLDEVRVFDHALNDDEVAALVMALTWRREGGRLTLSWPIRSPGSELQTRPRMNNGESAWTTVPGRPTAEDGMWRVEIALGATAAFYRLKKL